MNESSIITIYAYYWYIPCKVLSGNDRIPFSMSSTWQPTSRTSFPFKVFLHQSQHSTYQNLCSALLNCQLRNVRHRAGLWIGAAVVRRLGIHVLNSRLKSVFTDDHPVIVDCYVFLPFMRHIMISSCISLGIQKPICGFDFVMETKVYTAELCKQDLMVQSPSPG